MSGVVLQRPDSIAASSLYGGSGGATEQAICTMLAGETLLLRLRYSEFYFSGIALPQPTVSEGPYIRIRPALNRMVSRQADAGFVNSASPIARQPAGTINTSMRNDTDFFYEIDAQNCAPIVAPCDCSITLATGLAGIWAFDYAKFAVGNDQLGVLRNDKADNNRLYSHTRMVWDSGGPNSRTVDVPMGAVEMQPIGFQDATSPLVTLMELTSKTAGNGTSIITHNLVSNGRVPCVGARVGINSGATGEPSGVTFWCKLL